MKNDAAAEIAAVVTDKGKESYTAMRFGKKKEAAGGGRIGTFGENGAQGTSRFIVLGACCQKSTDTFNNVRQAVKELGFSEEVINIGDNLEIARYGVMQTPALVVDGRVVSYGKLLKVDDVKKIFAKLEVKQASDNSY